MTRREVLAWLGLAACGPRRGLVGGGSRGSAGRTSRSPRDASDDESECCQSISDDFSGWKKDATQLDRSPLVVRGELIARLTQEELQFVDAPSLKTTDHVTERYRSACAWKGTLFAFTHPENGPCNVDVFDRTVLLRSMPVGDCSSHDGASMTAAGASTIYAADANGYVERHRIKNDALVEDALVEVEDGADPSQLVGLDDGRVLFPGRDKKLGAFEGTSVVYYAAPQHPAHLCAGPNGRVWYSARKDHVLDQVVLAKLDTSLVPEATLAVTPGRITHMASGADGSLAIMTVGTANWIWTIILLDPKGAERKRIVVDDDLVKQVGMDLNVAFVALTPTTIVIDAGRHGLFGWNASTGARI